MEIRRWPARGPGRSKAVSYGQLIWLVANPADAGGDFRQQLSETLKRLETNLIEAGSDRSHLISVQVVLADIGCWRIFDDVWRNWIGNDPQGWPQRSCYQAVLNRNLLIEIIAVAARKQNDFNG